MRNTNKKGFTIVELVIVVAVIAILAAVLIPTFSGIIDKANMSADQQAINHINKLLAMEAPATTSDGAVEILIKNGYNGDLTTYYKGYTFGWVASKNVIVLVEEGKIVFPAAYEGLDYELINPMASDADSLVAGLVDGNVVYVSENLTVSVSDSAVARYGFGTATEGTYAVNLGGNTIVSDAYIGSGTSGVTMVISNGFVSGTTDDSFTEGALVVARAGGIVKLENVTVTAKAGVNPLAASSGELTLDNVTVNQYGEHESYDYYNCAIQVVAYEGPAKLTVNSGTYSGDKAIMMDAPGGNIIINGGTFIGETAAIKADYAQTYSEREHSITINGGNFTGALNIAAGVTCVINGGTFDHDVSADNNVTLGTGKTVVDNGDGTWTVK